MSTINVAFWIYRWLKLLTWIILCLLVFQLSRIIMYFYHHDYFNLINFKELLRIFLGGFRFDLVSIAIANLLLALLLILPVNFYHHNRLKGLFILNFVIVQLFLLFNFIDIPYFSFIHKRSTADIFFQIGGQTDILAQLPQYLLDYWWLLLIYISIVYLSFWGYKKLILSIFLRNWEYVLHTKNSILFIANVLWLITCLIISIRGGFQRIPLDIIDAGFYAEPQYTALVLNTPFSIVKSLTQNKLNEYYFFDDDEIIKSLKLVKKYPYTKMIKKNIVVIILESFSKEYTALGHKKSFTPFLDSLMKVSTVFENGWSNGTKSIEGIPAILSSVPSWMDNPFINSLYCNNFIPSLAFLLKKENYYSAFFHGGINGTMNFDAYAQQAQFDAYFGMHEYNNNKHFDGHWGIWDEPFLQYAASMLNKFPQPFFASIFTLSSHHPFNVPKEYENILPKGDLPIHTCIAYTDLALKKFFQQIKKYAWFQNTIFIITADHTGLSTDTYYSSIAGRYQIPIIIFNPSDSTHVIQKNIIQQIDILPTILYLFHYPHTFFSYGNNYWDNTIPHYSLFYENGFYYMADDSMLYSFQNFQLNKCWKYKNLILKESEINDTLKIQKEIHLKKIIQAYNNILIHNKIK